MERKEPLKPKISEGNLNPGPIRRESTRTVLTKGSTNRFGTFKKGKGVKGSKNGSDDSDSTSKRRFGSFDLAFDSSSDSDDELAYPIKDEDLLFYPDSQIRKWLKNHGKLNYIDFSDEKRLQLREYFDSMDEDKSGSIGAPELEDPLISLGLVPNRKAV